MSGPTGINGGVESGVFSTLASLVANTGVKEGTIARVFEQTNRGDYYVSSVDEKNGVLLNNGLYANPSGGGAGEMITKEFSYNNIIPTGQSGVILDLQATGDDLVELTWLLCTSTTDQPGITVTVDGVDIVTDVTLSKSNSTGNFGVGHQGFPTTGAFSILPSVKGKRILVNKATGVTSVSIRNSYQILGPA